MVVNPSLSSMEGHDYKRKMADDPYDKVRLLKRDKAWKRKDDQQKKVNRKVK